MSEDIPEDMQNDENYHSENNFVLISDARSQKEKTEQSEREQDSQEKNEKQEIKMAEVDTAVLSNGHTVLASEIAGVRHDVGLAESNVRGDLGQHSGLINKNIGDNGFRIAAAEANVRDKMGEVEGRLAKGIGDNRYTIASEACAINKHIGDIRQEDAENFGHTRRDIAAKAHELSAQIGKGFCDTDSKILETGSSIRREGSEHTNEIIKEGLKGDFNTRGDIKDARYDLSNKFESGTDRVVDRLTEHDTRVTDRFFTVGRDLMDLRQGQLTLAKDIELQALKTQIDAKENTKYLNDKIVGEGEKTRALLNDFKYHDLNRDLVERNAALIECESDRRRWKHGAEQNQWASQFAQLQSQIQAFNSQLQETRQGMVNFGTMTGVGQKSTSNNVK